MENRPTIEDVRTRIGNARSSQDADYWEGVETSLMDAEAATMAQAVLGIGMKANQIRHAQNLSVFTGFYHGQYYHDGVPQIPKK